MASKERSLGEDIDRLVDQFRSSHDANGTARELNRILRCLEIAKPGLRAADVWIPLGRRKRELISCAKAHVYAARWNRTGVHPVLFGRVLEHAKRAAQMTYSAFVIQAFSSRVRRVRYLKLKQTAEKTKVMMATNKLKQGKSGKYIDCDGSVYFFGVDRAQTWWQIVTQKEWDEHFRLGEASKLNNTSVMVLRGQWSNINTSNYSLHGNIQPVTGRVTLGALGLAYWRVQRVSPDLTNLACEYGDQVRDVSAHIDPGTGLWVSSDNRIATGTIQRLDFL